MTGINQLRFFLASVAPGPVADKETVERMLCSCWDELDGSGFGGMTARKLLYRTEKLLWKPPILGFQIERHGAAVAGSVYAHVQTWQIDVQRGTADLNGFEKPRLVGKRDKPLKVASLAVEIAQLIVSGREDARLKWLGPNLVRVEIGRVIPATNRETTAARRQRLIKALEKQLQSQGWQKIIAPYFPGSEVTGSG